MKILITGASKGLGLSTTKKLLSQGLSVYGASRTLPDELKDAKNFHHLQCDFTIKKDRAKIIKEIDQNQFSFIINNYAFFGKKNLQDLDYETFEKYMILNCYFPLEIFKAAQKKDALVGMVNISSLAGITEKDKFPGFGAYSMSKAALTTLTQTLSEEHGKTEKKIRFLCIAPGAMKTGMLNEALGENYPGGIETEKVADLIHFFITPGGSALDGQTIIINSN